MTWAVNSLLHLLMRVQRGVKNTKPGMSGCGKSGRGEARHGDARADNSVMGGVPSITVR
jgi:hypothetical protein